MNNKTIYTLSFILIAVLQLNNLLKAQSNADDINGLWHNEEKTAKIEVYSNANKYFGVITWVKLDPGDSGLDDENPDSKLKTKPLVGLAILNNFVYDDGNYSDGTIYDPKNGKTYSCNMKLESKNKLYVRGYIGFSLIGRTTYWTRIR